jgi:hypothetical protein
VLIPQASHLFLTDQSQIAHDAILNFLKAQTAGGCKNHPLQTVLASNKHPLSPKETTS